MIQVHNDVTVYEQDGKEVGGELNRPKLRVARHWTQSDKVVLEFEYKPGTMVTGVVLAKDLRAAVDNAVNTAR